jgi:hypothetical protein
LTAVLGFFGWRAEMIFGKKRPAAPRCAFFLALRAASVGPAGTLPVIGSVATYQVSWGEWLFF